MNKYDYKLSNLEKEAGGSSETASIETYEAWTRRYPFPGVYDMKAIELWQERMPPSIHRRYDIILQQAIETIQQSNDLDRS